MAHIRNNFIYIRPKVVLQGINTAWNLLNLFSLYISSLTTHTPLACSRDFQYFHCHSIYEYIISEKGAKNAIPDIFNSIKCHCDWESSPLWTFFGWKLVKDNRLKIRFCPLCLVLVARFKVNFPVGWARYVCFIARCLIQSAINRRQQRQYTINCYFAELDVPTNIQTNILSIDRCMVRTCQRINTTLLLPNKCRASHMSSVWLSCICCVFASKCD